MNMLRKVGTGVAVAAVAATALTYGSVASFAWEPNKPIEFVIMAGKGGGADKMARLMQSVVEKHKMSPMPLLPVNKPGGSGAEALVHLNGKKGADANHTIMVTLNSFYTTPLRQPALGVDSLTFAPIARMAEDTFLLCRASRTSMHSSRPPRPRAMSGSWPAPARRLKTTCSPIS
jgi:tripartite-type tricarboxylate transporter receptor subunit TctC